MEDTSVKGLLAHAIKNKSPFFPTANDVKLQVEFFLQAQKITIDDKNELYALIDGVNVEEAEVIEDGSV